MHKIDLKVEEIVIKIRHKTNATEIKDYRFNVVLNFFTGDQDSSIAQVRVQMKSSKDKKDDQQITFVKWMESPIERCTNTVSSGKFPKLTKLADGHADLILSKGISGNLRIKLNELDDIMECGIGPLSRADRLVVQWVNLGREVRNNPSDLFIVQYELQRELILSK